MADTFEQVYRELLLYAPACPVPLAEHWVRNRYRQVCEGRQWSFLRAADQFLVADAYSTGTVTVTRSSTTVTGSGTAWTTAMSGRQVKFSSTSPVYTITITASDELAQTLTLDKAFGGTTAAGVSYQILQCYVTAPTNFLTFLSCVNVSNMWRLWVNFFTTEDLDRIDPIRTSSGQPYLVAALRNTSAEVAQFELWPHPTSQAQYPFTYIKRVTDFASGTTLPTLIRGDILLKGALADLCKWPGSGDSKNPMFRMDLALQFEKEFIAMVAEAWKQDNEIYQTDLSYTSALPMAPLSASFAQSHALYEPVAAVGGYPL